MENLKELKYKLENGMLEVVSAIRKTDYYQGCNLSMNQLKYLADNNMEVHYPAHYPSKIFELLRLIPTLYLDGDSEDPVLAVADWFQARNLITADPKAQFLKLVEEFGEFSFAIENHDLEEARDAIGDTFVVAIGMYLQVEYLSGAEFLQDNLDALEESVRCGILDSFTELGDRNPVFALGCLASSLAKAHSYADIQENLIIFLEDAFYYFAKEIRNEFPTETVNSGYGNLCLGLAWKEISTRTGKMIDGVFVKDTPKDGLTEEEVLDVVKGMAEVGAQKEQGTSCS